MKPKYITINREEFLKEFESVEITGKNKREHAQLLSIVMKTTGRIKEMLDKHTIKEDSLVKECLCHCHVDETKCGCCCGDNACHYEVRTCEHCKQDSPKRAAWGHYACDHEKSICYAKPPSPKEELSNCCGANTDDSGRCTDCKEMCEHDGPDIINADGNCFDCNKHLCSNGVHKVYKVPCYFHNCQHELSNGSAASCPRCNKEQPKEPKKECKQSGVVCIQDEKDVNKPKEPALPDHLMFDFDTPAQIEELTRSFNNLIDYLKAKQGEHE